MCKEHSVYLAVTMDTKAREAFFLKKEIEDLGHLVKIIDIGTRKKSPEGVEITQAQVLDGYLDEAAVCETRSEAARYVTAGLNKIVRKLYEEGRLAALISLGGSGGSSIASEAMHQLPLGVPKVIVTTMASGNTLPYVQGEDILLINPVVDIQNLNFMTRHVLRQAAAVLDGMLRVSMRKQSAKAIAITGFGVTTPCVDRCTELLEAAGYEVLIFHARGISGGKIMEKMIYEGCFQGVLDITTSEVADEICGGIYGVKDRMLAAVKMGIPYVVVPGALEMINLSTQDTLEPWQKKRVLYMHSPSSVKMRANGADMEKLARVFCDRLGQGSQNVKLMIPERGFSSVNQKDSVFYDKNADQIFVETVKKNMPKQISIICDDVHINDPAFAERLVDELLAMM